ncbi:pyridoxine/pyridoxal/pyridoxamine kinase [Stutzerimonas chloritidismutans]|uniref:pyridoxine/pyridoxal/pyridoxamine kinase n=1 Tax=Stutzerimonas chloritidismutans TaxID=203192 RepID=UPI0008D8125E|nr:pyridoxine/pyridoxal/pyridoxamine kinase [Stutzerimonas chloritidismutans]OHC14283.1 MAG: bifunctional pyridoxal kinase/hydroxymethylpyrimidine kinase [Pseudomonadales bacterium GWC2_63_15]
MAVSIDFASVSGPEPLPLDVISIQSQVVYGCVGNSIAVPVLNAGGLSVGAIPTVLLSNTPHYSTCHGGALPTSWFAGYLKDLEARDALRSVRTVLVGYLGSTTQAAVLARWLGTVLERYPDIRVQLDPVLGDDDCGMYVEPAMVSAFQTHLLRFAHGLTPNAFELARLSGRRVETVEQVIDAARSLLIGGTQWVVVTSAAQHEWPSERMYVVVVTKESAEVIEHERVSVSPKGTGDFFSAALAAALLRGLELTHAVKFACRQVIDSLALTRQSNSAELRLPAFGSSLFAKE